MMTVDMMDQREMAIRDRILWSISNAKVSQTVVYNHGDKTVRIEIQGKIDTEWILETTKLVYNKYGGDSDVISKLYAALAHEYHSSWILKISEFNPDGSGTTFRFNE